MISPALHFPGNCSEAMAFYEKAFNATDKQVAYFRDAPPDPGFPVTDEMKDLVMHASMTICGTPVNFSDTQEEAFAGNMICLNVFFPTAEGVCRAFDSLKEGGKVVVALGPQFFSAMYGAVEDKFRIKWQLIS